MNDEDRINKINNELKTYINEAKFISNKCRNRIIKLLGEEFNIIIDKSNYEDFANVDVQIDQEGSIIIRGNIFKNNIRDIDKIEESFNSFKEKADNYLEKREINFESKNNLNNIINLVMVLLILFIFIIISFISIKSILDGNFHFAVWFIVFVIPYIIPGLKDSLFKRIHQARVFIKRYLKKHR